MSKLLAILILGLLFESQANACSCMAEEKSGFFSKHSQTLPSNAKGILFFRDPLSVLYPSDPNIKITPLTPKDFRLRDSKTNKAVTTRVVRVKAVDGLWEEYKKSLEQIVGDKRRENALKSMGLFRIEPVSGFVAGHTYNIEYVGKPKLEGYSSLEIDIAAKPIDLKALDSVTYALKGVPSVVKDLLVVTGEGSCTRKIQAAVQEMTFEMASELADYKGMFRQFLYVRSGDGDFKRWSFTNHSCSRGRFGDQSARKYFRTCPKDLRHKEDYSSILIDEVYATWGFFEMEDVLHKSKNIPMNFDEALKGCG